MEIWALDPYGARTCALARSRPRDALGVISGRSGLGGSLIGSADKGRELERRIADFFGLNGYKTERNVFLHGRSGAKHEVDVVADRSDGITSFRVIIECKAWDMPIEKETVAKLEYVLRDVGANKGIIVTLSGWRTGADQAARQLAIELWGPDELEKRLGQVVLASLHSGPVGERIMGFRCDVPQAQARSVIEPLSKGRLGLGKEEIVGTWLAWLPIHFLEIACSRVEKQRFRKPALVTRTIWNGYEGIGGRLWISLGEPMNPRELSVPVLVPPRVKDSLIVGELTQAAGRLNEVVRTDAVARHAHKLSSLGVPLPVSSLTVGLRQEIYVPYYLALLRARGGGERLVAVDGLWGVPNNGMGISLTANRDYVMSAIQGRASEGGRDEGHPSPAPQSDSLPRRPDL
jgi:hypothetical protein